MLLLYAGDLNNLEDNIKNESAETPAGTNISDTNQEDKDDPEAAYVQEPLLLNPSGNYNITLRLIVTSKLYSSPLL